MNKRLSILPVLVLISLMVASQPPLKEVNLLPLWFPQAQFAGFYMAREKGIYERYGMKVNIISGGVKRSVTDYLKSGKADFGIMNLCTAIKIRNDSLPLVNIGQLFQQSDVVFVAKKKSGINTISDFAGRRIAVWRTVLEDLTLGFLTMHQINADVIRINEGVSIFLKDAVDICAVMHYNEYNSLINYGINPDELSVFYLRDYNANLPEDGIYCTENTYQSDPLLCQKFVQASLEGWKYALAHREETLELIRQIQKRENISDNIVHASWMLNAMNDQIYPKKKKVMPGELLEEDYNKTVSFLYLYRGIQTNTPFRTFYKGINRDE